MPNNGGQAFPRAGSQFSPPVDGMSLRDWFAGQVIAAIADEPRDTGEIALIVRRAYTIADAMLAERERLHWKKEKP